MEIKEKDILLFKNGEQRECSKYDKWVIEKFYNKDLTPKSNDDYTIIDILRPYYYSVKGKDDMLNVFSMTIEELRDELRERRLQVNNLTKEIQRKDETIEKYNKFYNEIMEKEYNGRIEENGENRNASKKRKIIKKSNR